MGIALCGLGNYARRQLAPALEQTGNCRLTGAITGSPEKVPALQKKHPGLTEENVFSYGQIEELAACEEIDVVYVVTPHGLHYRDTMAALEAGKHVIVEKPMAGTAAECREMILLAEKKGLGLQTGYRLHWDPYHNALREAVRRGEIGEFTELSGGLGYRSPDPGPQAWQVKKELAISGALHSLGVYPIQAAHYLMMDNPVAVTAESIAAEPDYHEVPLAYQFQLRFASGLAFQGRASSGQKMNDIRGKGNKGAFKLEPSYAYDGLKGAINGRGLNFGSPNQQALQMDAQCLAMARQIPGLTPGEMGLRDVIILEAIMEAAQTGREVRLPEQAVFPAHR